MSFTVHDLIQLPELQDVAIYSGEKSLKRNINYVAAIEASDGLRLFENNTLVICSLPEMELLFRTYIDFFQQLSAFRIAAVCVYLPSNGPQTPPEAWIQSAKQHNVPFLSIPGTHSYSAVITQISTQITNNHMLQLQAALNASYMFIHIANDGGNLDSIARSLSLALRRPVIIEGSKNELLSFHRPESASIPYSDGYILSCNRQVKNQFYQAALKQEIYSTYQFPSSSTVPFSFVIAPIISQGTVLGSISIADIGEDEVPLNKLILRNAAIFTAISISGLRAQEAKERMIRDGILTDLLYKNTYTKESASYWISYFRLEEKLPYIVFLLKPVNCSERNAYAFQQLTTTVIRDAYFFPQEECSLFIKSFASAPKHQLQRDIDEYFAVIKSKLEKLSKNTSFYIAVGELCTNIYDISKHYRQAKIALDIGASILPANSLCRYSDLDLYYIFDDRRDRKGLITFAMRYLHPLLKVDATSFDAIETLRTYLECGSSIKKTSELLYLHENTIKYRIRRLEEILGVDLHDQNNIIRLRNALIIFRMYPNDFMSV